MYLNSEKLSLNSTTTLKKLRSKTHLVKPERRVLLIVHGDCVSDHFLQRVRGAAQDALVVADHPDGAAGVDHQDLWVQGD